MDKIKVESTTLVELSAKVKSENDKLLQIVSDIKNMTINYQDMLISDAGKLFCDVVVKEQENMAKEILQNNLDIADKLTSFSEIYDDTNTKIGGLFK